MYVLRKIPTAIEIIQLWPPGYSTAYIKTTANVLDMDGHKSLNPAMPLTGDGYPYCWMASNSGNMRLHVDLGASKVLKKVIYCNYHNAGWDTNRGVNAYTIQAGNDAGAFNNLDYGADHGWTTLATGNMTQHPHDNNQVVWREIAIASEAPARYIAFKCASNFGGNYIGIRRIQLYGY